MIKDHINNIKNDISEGLLTEEEIFQKHIIDSKTYFFNDYLKDLSLEYQTKTIIAKALGVHINEVLFVGSSKLGFSLNPKSTFTHFDALFNETNLIKDKSDLDIAVVSNELFNKIIRESYDFTESYSTKWYKNEYYQNPIKGEIPLCYKYYEYITKGWFRPDMRPPEYEFCVEGNFEKLKGHFFKNYRRKIGLGIYKDWFFFKKYHINNLKNLTFRVKSEIL